MHSEKADEIDLSFVTRGMALLVHGFPTKLAALQFEWAWQHPDRSRQFIKSRKSSMEAITAPAPASSTPRMPVTVKDKLAVLYTMLRRPSWRRWPLSVHIMDVSLVEAWNDLEKSYKEESSETLPSKNTDTLCPIPMSNGPLDDLKSHFSDRGHRQGKFPAVLPCCH